MIERLVGLNMVQERFIAHAAHELRTPLTSLRIELELALRTAVDRSDFDTALRGALDSSRRLSDLAEDLLQLARMRATTEEGTVDVGAALSDAISDVAAVGRARDVFIVHEGVGGTVRGERRGLARLFRNVLENAVRHSPNGGRIRIHGERLSSTKGEELEIAVVDDGPGIDPEDVDRIFEPFARGTRTSDPTGTGLGLTIARELARSFGGELRATAGSRGRFIVRVAIA